MKNFKILNHPTDLKVKSWGQDLPILFANLVDGMFYGVTEKLGQGKEKINFEIEGAPDNETLLVNFLNAIWVLGFGKNSAIGQIKFNKFGLDGIAGEGKLLSVSAWKAEVKAATFYNLKIKRTKDGFETTVVFDI